MPLVFVISAVLVMCTDRHSVKDCLLYQCHNLLRLQIWLKTQNTRKKLYEITTHNSESELKKKSCTGQ